MKPIVIRQGDDSDFMDQKIVLATTDVEDLSDYRIIFTLGPITKTYENLNGQKIELFFTKEETKQLPVGGIYGALKVVDSYGKEYTTLTNIYFKILPELVKC